MQTEPLPINQTIISGVYPNPIVMNENLNINVQNNLDVNNLKIEFYDITGKMIGTYLNSSTLIQGNNIINIALSRYMTSSGIYFLVFYDGDRKIAKQKIIFIK